MSQKKIKRQRTTPGDRKKEEITIVNGLSILKILKENWVFLALLLLGTVAIYFNSLKGNFVSDDYASIPQNPMVTSFTYMLSGLFVGMTNWFLATVFGIQNTVPYHILNLGFYLLALVAVFVFVYLIAGRRIATFSSLLFAVLPIHVEAVSWVSGKPYIITGFFILLAIIGFWQYLTTAKRNYLWLIIGGSILAFFTDRVRSFSILLIIFLLAISFLGKKGIKIDWKKVLLVMFGLGLIAVILMVPLISSRINSVNSGYNDSGSIFYDPFFQYPTAIAKYLQLVIFPFDLTLYHTMYILPVWLNWLIVLIYVTSCAYFWFKNRLVSFSLLFIFIATLPSMAPVKVSWLVAERYMFLGALGVCIIAAVVLSHLYNKSRALVMVILAMIASVYGYRIYMRNIDWSTNHNLWVNTCQVSPNSHNAWNNIGDDYDKLKDYTDAVKGFTQSTIVKPNYADAYHNRGNIFFKTGRLDLARDSYMTAIYYSPTLYHSYLSLTQIDLMEKRMDLAIQHAQKVTEIQPNDPQSWYVMGVVLAQVGNKEEAIKSMKNALLLNPNYSPAQQALSQLSQVPEPTTQK
ncbi:tetratricopeptide repeat protein [Patescibacteria group bacterium]|nr:tetratricopeptide repeat protein [Patescibacteria group bacterium]